MKTPNSKHQITNKFLLFSGQKPQIPITNDRNRFVEGRSVCLVMLGQADIQSYLPKGSLYGDNASMREAFKGMTRVGAKNPQTPQCIKRYCDSITLVWNLVLLVEGNGQARYFVSEKAKHVFGYLVIVYLISSPLDCFPEGTNFF